MPNRFCGVNYFSISHSFCSVLKAKMASIVAQLLPPHFLANGSQQSYPTSLPKLSLPSTRVRKGNFLIVTKATGESSEATSLSIVESVQNVWNKSEDRLALIGFGFAGIVAIWASSKVVTAIDKLPFIPSTFEFIGILYSSWFTYRYLLFRPDREELLRNINKSVSEILGQ